MRLALVIAVLAVFSVTTEAAAPEESFVAMRVMTYNIHSCKGRDGNIRPDRIADVIREFHPDVVVLEEVRVGLTDAGVPIPLKDQPRVIAEANGMHYVFYPLVRTKVEDYGIAILSRHPVRLIRAENLPTWPRRRPLERRGAIWAEVTVDGMPIQILGTHLGLNTFERMAQVDALLGPDWMGSEKFSGAFALAGDLNARPGQSAYKKVAALAVDAALLLKGKKASATWPSSMPVFRIDHVFIPKSARVVAVDVPRTPLTRISSDHLPLIADLAFPRAAQGRQIDIPPHPAPNDSR